MARRSRVATCHVTFDRVRLAVLWNLLPVKMFTVTVSLGLGAP
jgi:hypothetical protein